QEGQSLLPFCVQGGMEVADYLLRSSLDMAAIDEFLKLHMIQNLQLSFSNASELCSRAEMLPSGPSWKCQTIPSLHPTKLPIRLFWRDPIECLESLFSNPLFHDKLNFIPRHVYKTAARLLRVYSEWLTGNSAWDVQVCAGSVYSFCTVLSPFSDKSRIIQVTRPT
ncbi:hypothetical protein DFJ58DRAFT_663368, partial [Suillus subalutaceus]|uniref:uncharacterized protein n=1 Tax=Suillus subalutaceus TaxID=48586 RepID=UPI001B8793EC